MAMSKRRDRLKELVGSAVRKVHSLQRRNEWRQSLVDASHVHLLKIEIYNEGRSHVVRGWVMYVWGWEKVVQTVAVVSDDLQIIYTFLRSLRPTSLLQDHEEFQMNRPGSQQSVSPSEREEAADIFDNFKNALNQG